MDAMRPYRYITEDCYALLVMYLIDMSAYPQTRGRNFYAAVNNALRLGVAGVGCAPKMGNEVLPVGCMLRHAVGALSPGVAGAGESAILPRCARPERGRATANPGSVCTDSQVIRNLICVWFARNTHCVARHHERVPE